MKRMNLTKKITAVVLAVAVIMTGMAIMPNRVQAADTVAVATSVKYEETYSVDSNNVPILDGYLFGGYYDANKNAMDTSEGAKYAKFVPAHVLSIKAQNYVSTAWSDSTNKANASDSVKTKKTTTRLVTGVDCLDYKSVGFIVTRPSDGKTANVSVTKVYEKLAVNSDKYSADLILGSPAAYYAVLEYSGIEETTWDENIYVKPYWVTKDDTTVYGLPKYVRVDDGLEDSEGYKYISVPVNLNTAEMVAAGVVNVSYDKTQLEFDSYSVGKVFEEMEIAEKTATDGTKSIKCVGNVFDIKSNKAADDIYISLRFKVIGNYSVMDDGGLNFKMDQIDFADNGEEIAKTNVVWDVLY